jgi:hypothetical protein
MEVVEEMVHSIDRGPKERSGDSRPLGITTLCSDGHAQSTTRESTHVHTIEHTRTSPSRLIGAARCAQSAVPV